MKMDVTTFILIPQFSICYTFQNIRTFELGFMLSEKKYSYYDGMVSSFFLTTSSFNRKFASQYFR